MDRRFVTVEKGLGPQGRIAVVRFDRGDNINALSQQAMRELRDVPRDFEDRGRLPHVDTPEGVVRIAGRIAPPPARLFDFAGAGAEPGFSRIRQNLDLNAFRAETGLPLVPSGAPLSVLQTGAPSEGLLREWPVIGTGVERHYGYAFQWFGLCSLIALLYVWFQLVRRFLRPRGQRAS